MQGIFLILTVTLLVARLPRRRSSTCSSTPVYAWSRPSELASPVAQPPAPSLAQLIFALFCLLPCWRRSSFLFAEPTSTSPRCYTRARRHLLGTTVNGQDILSQLIWGARRRVSLGLVCGALISLVQLIMGVFAATSAACSTLVAAAVTNVFLVLPSSRCSSSWPLLARRGLLMLVGVITITAGHGGPKCSGHRQSPSGTGPLVQAARSPVRAWHIVFAHVVPNMLGIIVSNFFGATLFAVLAEAGLEFIGLATSTTSPGGPCSIGLRSGDAILLGRGCGFSLPGLCLALWAHPWDCSTSPWTRSPTPALRRD